MNIVETEEDKNESQSDEKKLSKRRERALKFKNFQKNENDKKIKKNKRKIIN